MSSAPPTFIDRRNLEFLLYELFDVESLTRHAPFLDHDRSSFDLALGTASQLANDILWPAFREMDRQAPALEDGRVRVHARVETLLRECGRGGWINADVSVEHIVLDQLPAIRSLDRTHPGLGPAAIHPVQHIASTIDLAFQNGPETFPFNNVRDLEAGQIAQRG